MMVLFNRWSLSLKWMYIEFHFLSHSYNCSALMQCCHPAPTNWVPLYVQRFYCVPSTRLPWWPWWPPWCRHQLHRQRLHLLKTIAPHHFLFICSSFRNHASLLGIWAHWAQCRSFSRRTIFRFCFAVLVFIAMGNGQCPLGILIHSIPQYGAIPRRPERYKAWPSLMA